MHYYFYKTVFFFPTFIVVLFSYYPLSDDNQLCRQKVDWEDGGGEVPNDIPLRFFFIFKRWDLSSSFFQVSYQACYSWSYHKSFC